ASSADGSKLVAVAGLDFFYISADSGVTWVPRGPSRTAYGVATSADGTKLVVAAASTQIYTSAPAKLAGTTTAGTAGGVMGGRYDAISLQYLGNNIFTVLNSAGALVVQ
ncbi:MAG: hypothetical protein OEW21_18685, partial [Betaproteobacteria bacterium]|nr:hypothetical protein [Betaproteobacteria bacterium]